MSEDGSEPDINVSRSVADKSDHEDLAAVSQENGTAAQSRGLNQKHGPLDDGEEVSHKRKSKKKKKKKDRSKKRRYDSESEDNNSELSLHDNRSVFSETVYEKTYQNTNSVCSTSSHSRFNPHKKQKVGPILSPDMTEYLADNFNLFLKHEKIEELILKSYPIPEDKSLTVKKMDPLVKSILEELRKSFDKVTDQALMSVQQRLFTIMGPLGHLWTMLEKINNSFETVPEDGNTPTQIDSIDIRQIIDLIEKTICCVGQTNVSINYQRRAAVLSKITNDSVKAKSFLREKQDSLAKSGDLLFGNDFKTELKELSETKKEAGKMAEALGVKPRTPTNLRRSRDEPHKKTIYAHRRDYRHAPSRNHRDDNRPFPSGPSFKSPGQRNGGKRRITGNKPLRFRYVYIKKSDCKCKHECKHKRKFRFGHTGQSRHSRPIKKNEPKTYQCPNKPHGRSTSPSLRKLVKSDVRSDNPQLHSGNKTRLLVPTCTNKNSPKYNCKSERTSSVKSRNSRHERQKSHSRGSPYKNTIYKQPLSGPQKGRGAETCDKPTSSQSICNIQTFQNGRSFYVKRSSTKRRLSGKNRFKGSLLSDANTHDTSKIPEVSVGRQDIRIHCPPLWPRSGSPDFHKNFKTNCRFTKENGNKTDRLSGRHSSDGKQPRKANSSQKLNTLPPSESRLCHKLGKIYPGTFPDNRISRLSNKLKRNDVFSSNKQNRRNKNDMSKNAITKKCVRQGNSKINREIDCLGPGNFSSKSKLSISSNESNKRASSRKILRTLNSFKSRCKTGTYLVGKSNRKPQWQNYHKPKSRPCFNVRCIKYRLGGLVSKQKYRRGVVQRGSVSTHQCKRITSSLSCYSNFCEQESNSSSFKDGQHVSSVLCQSIGRDKVQGPKFNNETNLGLVPNKKHNSDSRVSSGEIKSFSRLGIKECRRSKRLAIRPSNFRRNQEFIWGNGDRSIRVKTKSPSDEICQLETRPNEYRNRCISPKLDRNQGLCISPICPNREMSRKSEKRKSDPHTYSSNLADPTLVPGPLTVVDSGPNKTTNLSETFVVPSGETSSPDRQRDTVPRGMENIRQGNIAAKLSKTAADLHEKAWRPGTQVAYKSAWGKWSCWCLERSLDPFQTTVENIVEFLTKLFQEGLQYRTINTYRSAISKNHALIDNLQVGKHPFIIKHMRAIFNQRVPMSKYEFSWDADLVLSQISSWGKNEDLEIKLLSWKLSMLLALASASRASELSYLNCKSMKKQGSTIHFELLNRTKTCRPGSDNRQLSFASFENDNNLCVVSCINEYLKRTKEWRNINDKIDRSRLILSFVKPHKPITPSSIARWLKETIKKAGISDVFKGHSTRSASTSKAKRVGLSTQDIIEQANWTKESTFMRFYCKPLSGSSIAYQHAVFTRNNNDD